MSAHEIAEHIEHAAHGGNPKTSRYIGITMAVLGVLVALCSALVGAERTELITAMVEQSTRMGTYHTETMKFRAMRANGELLKALSPDHEEIAKIEETLRSKRRSNGRADDEDTAELKDLIASSVEDLADLLTPDKHVLADFNKVAKLYERDMKEAKEDADAYDQMIKARQEAAEGYERGLLAAEIGIVIASVALLLANRAVWVASLLLAILCLGKVGITYERTGREVAEANKKIEAAAKNVIELEKDDEQE